VDRLVSTRAGRVVRRANGLGAVSPPSGEPSLVTHLWPRNAARRPRTCL